MSRKGGKELAGLFFPPISFSNPAYFRISFLVIKLVFEFFNELTLES